MHTVSEKMWFAKKEEGAEDSKQERLRWRPKTWRWQAFEGVFHLKWLCAFWKLKMHIKWLPFRGVNFVGLLVFAVWPIMISSVIRIYQVNKFSICSDQLKALSDIFSWDAFKRWFFFGSCSMTLCAEDSGSSRSAEGFKYCQPRT